MNIRIHGCNDEYLRKEILSATRFFASELLSKKMLPFIKLDINLCSNIAELGSCTVAYTNDWYKPREFEIDIKRKRSVKNMLITLAHEMVHVKQFAKCELKDDHTKWMGKKINSNRIAYENLPWEREAVEKEFMLFAMYKDSKEQK